MEFKEALELIENILKIKTGKELTEPEKEIIKAAWENETYTMIADSLYLTVGHIKDLASLLWKRLSDVTGKKVTKKNLRYLFEDPDSNTVNYVDEIDFINSNDISTEKARVLIVDDSVVNLLLLSKMLMIKGYTVETATNGKKALEAIQANLPNVILLDVRMPEMDGYELCKILKSDPVTSEIPIIFLSSLDDVLTKIEAFQAGGIDYITKPFYPEEIVVRIQNQITIQQQKLELKKEIEKHQQTAEILYQSRSLLANLLNSSLDGIAALQAVTNPISGNIDDFIILVVNPVFANLFKEDRHNLTGKMRLKTLLNKINPELFDLLVEVVNTGKPIKHTFSYQADDSQKWYYWIVVRLGYGCSVTIREIV